MEVRFLRPHRKGDHERGNVLHAAAVALLLLAFTGCNDGIATPNSLDSSNGPLMAARGGSGGRGGGGHNLIVELKGTGTGSPQQIDGRQMDCFDVQLFDVATGNQIGTGTDCLDLSSITGNPTIGAFAISNTTFFNFPGGLLKSRNRTTISPLVEGSPGLTHSTTDVPTANNILDGTGRFGGAEGIARLAGAVDMSRFFSSNIISFNCIFVLSFD